MKGFISSGPDCTFSNICISSDCSCYVYILGLWEVSFGQEICRIVRLPYRTDYVVSGMGLQLFFYLSE